MIVRIELKTDKKIELLRAINKLKLISEDLTFEVIEDNEK